MTSLKKLTYSVVVALLLLGCSDTLSAQLVATPGQIVFNAQPGANPAPQTLQLSTGAGQSVPFAIQVATSSGGQWLSISPGSGNTPAQILVGATSAFLASGSYNGVITITSSGVSNSPLSVPVTLNIGSQLASSPTSISFNYQSGGAIPNPTSIAVNSTSGSGVGYTASAQTTSGGTWLLVNPTSGTTPGTVNVSFNPSGLSAGTYSGTVHLAAAAVGTAALDVPVTLTISANPTLSVTPSGGLSFAYQTGTSSPGAQTLTFATNGGAVQFNLSPQTTSGGSWLVLNTFGGQASQSAPQAVSVSANVSGLPAGVYSGSIVVSSPSAANPTFTIPVSLLVSANPLLLLGAQPAAFNYQIGGGIPTAQTVQVNSSSTPLAFSAAVATVSGGSWLSVSPQNGTTPQPLTLSVNPVGLAAGQYTGSITVSSAGAGNSPQTITVTLNVSATNMLNVSSGSLLFNYQTTTNLLPNAQVVNVTSTGGPVSYTVSATTSSCGNWLNVSQASGTTPGAFNVSVNTTGITPQACTGSITVSSAGAGNTVTIPVSLNVSTNPLLNIAPTSLNFAAPLGAGSLPTPLSISLTSTDSSSIPFTVGASTSTGGSWLFVTSSTGSTPSNVQVTVNPSGLPVGIYTGTVTITSPNLPAAQAIPVTLTVTSNITAAANPASVTLAAPMNSTTPVTAQVQITATGPVTFSTAASTVQGGTWLSVSPAGGSTPGTITISANATGLSQGVYSGQVTVQIPGANNSPINIPVTLTVGPAASVTVSAQTLTFTSALGAGSNPATQTFNVTSVGGPVQFSVAAATTSCGNFLTATPASATTPAAVTVGVDVTNLPQGNCSGTVTISAPGFAPQTVPVTLTITQAAAPVITAVTNAASYNPGPVAPGEIVTIFGANMGPTTLTTVTTLTNNAFPTTLGGVQVFFDNNPAPLIYVRNNQLSAVVPFEVAGRPTTNVTVRYLNQTSGPLSVRVVDFAPGIFTSNQQGSGQGAVVNQNGELNSATAPAARGQVIAIYMTGAGLMTSGNTTGGVLSPTPLPTLPSTAPVTVTIGGQTAQVQYAGGAPGLIAGAYQINAVIPAGAASGTQTLVVSVAGQPAQSNVTLNVQ